jgi:signal transduction histidine kinase
MRRLYLKIYLAFVGIVAVFSLVLASVWWHQEGGPRGSDFLHGTAVALELALPPPGAPGRESDAKLARLAAAFGIRIALFDASGSRVAGAGGAVPAPDVTRAESHWASRRRHGATAALRLEDGRWVVIRSDRDGPPGMAWLLNLALLAAIIGGGAYPVARGITRRLERLSARVEEFGAGDLQTRAAVEGRDEVAQLAERFNRAADRIETLVASQRNLLASTSHELRSPLARLRMAVELLGDDADPKLRAQVERDVADLDAALEELLAVSRLDLLDATAHAETVDFLALTAEEASHFGVEVEGSPASLRGDARSLRHLVRNLLENARRHAPGAPIRVHVRAFRPGWYQRTRGRRRARPRHRATGGPAPPRSRAGPSERRRRDPIRGHPARALTPSAGSRQTRRDLVA